MKLLKPRFFWRPMIPVSSRGIELFVDGGRRDLLDHVIVFNERHLKRLMTKYVRYYHEDRTHLALEKRTPAGSAGSGGYGCDLQSPSHAETRWPPLSLRSGRLNIHFHRCSSN